MNETIHLKLRSADVNLAGERLIQIAGVPDFWERVRGAAHRLLAIDYDGTLAPFRVEREKATPLDGVHEALKNIRKHHGTQLAILSGRPARNVLELLGRDLHISVFGAHGYERVHADGTLENFPPTKQQANGLAKAAALAVNAGFAETLEEKLASVAVHTRALANPEDVEKRFRTLWKPLVVEHELTIMHFNRGVELRAQGRNKGVALANLYDEMPPDTFAVYIGDDSTDEDAFRYVKSHGIGIKVGIGRTATEATGRVPDQAAVLAILRDWQHVTAARD